VLKIHEARPVAAVGAPGELLPDCVVACGGGTGWRLSEVQPEGKKRMPATAWLSGARLPPNLRLGSD
jgi:methionyl-tRNA formyltransferase